MPRILFDPNLFLAFSVLLSGNADLIFQRLGIRIAPGDAFAPIPIHATLGKAPTREDLVDLAKFGLVIPEAFLAEAQRNPALRSLCGVLNVPIRTKTAFQSWKQRLTRFLGSNALVDLRVASSLHPCDVGPERETHTELGIPPDRRIVLDATTYVADGRGTIIGIIDDGCALANWNFVRDGPASRILCLWDQGQVAGGGAWTRVGLDQGLGYELVNVAGHGPTPIDDALATHTNAQGIIDEDKVYAQLGYFPYATLEGRPFIAASHGTHVMDVAAGSGRALFGNVGVAPAAEIIFVQLPPELVAEGGVALTRCIHLGAQYIVDRVASIADARQTRIPYAINISFGGYCGSHDGRMPVEKYFDEILELPDRAVVLAAGNGYAEGCHAQGTIRKGHERVLRWQVPPFDESINHLEVWYAGKAEIAFYVTPPDGAEQGPFPPSVPLTVYDGAGKAAGTAQHVPDPAGDRSLFQIELEPTCVVPPQPGSDGPASPSAKLAPAGTWRIRLVQPVAGQRNRFHTWIERDVRRSQTQKMRRQSRFHDEDCHPATTLSGLATGRSTIVAGGYNVATGEVAEYSACGPTRPYPASAPPRRKPEVCAPSAFDALSAGVSSAAARFALRTRMGGTSVAAPHVAGLTALILQINMERGQPPLPVDELRRIIAQGASNAGNRVLKPNRHQAADPHQHQKQASMLADLVGAGRADAWASLSLL